MNRVYVLAPRESWIVDRFVEEFTRDNSAICTDDPWEATVIWLLSDWCWRQLPIGLLRSKKVITTVHHIVPDKFGPAERADFAERDAVTTTYHVYNQRTFNFVKPLTHRPIRLVPYWANQKIWHPTGTRADIRLKHGLSIDAFIIGSFQRDTEGAGIPQGIFLPKLEKGVDLLADFLEGLLPTHPSLHVCLAGWRRQYLVARLESAHVPFTYFELPSQETLNELYQTLDLYPVTARYEGGPQALIEAGLLGVPCVSRPVGIAEQVLPTSAINDDVSLAVPAVPNVEAWKLPGGYASHLRMIHNL